MVDLEKMIVSKLTRTALNFSIHRFQIHGRFDELSIVSKHGSVHRLLKMNCRILRNLDSFVRICRRS